LRASQELSRLHPLLPDQRVKMSTLI
jgi:hypothetical protein